MKLTSILLAATLLAAPVAIAQHMMGPPAAGPAAGDHASLPMTFTNGIPTLQIMVNGKGPFTVGFDTGAMGGPHMNDKMIAALGIEPFGEAHATDPSGKNPRTVKLYKVDSAQFEGVTLNQLVGTSTVLSGKKLETLDAIVGLEGFAGLVVTLDYVHGRFSAERGALPAPEGKTVFAYTGPPPSAPLTVEGKTLDAHLDTGNIRYGVIVPTEFAAGLSRKAEAKSIGVARTVSNTIEMFAEPVAGGVTMAGTPLTVTDVGYPSVAAIGNVGSLALTNMVVRVDPKNKRIQLERALRHVR